MTENPRISGRSTLQIPNRPDVAARSVVNGLVISVVSLASTLAYTALIFSGLLSSGLGEGASAALLGTALVGLVIAWRSAFPFAIAGSDGYHCAVLAGIAAVLGTTLAGGGRAPTVNALYLVMLSALLNGVVLYVMGATRMGRWFRFVPYPVTGGFFVGLGWLMVAGGVKIATNLPLTFANLDDLFTTALFYKMVAVFICAVLLAWIMRRSSHMLTMPGALVGGTLAGLVLLSLSGHTLAQARSEGWLFDVPLKLALWTPWSASDFALLDTAGLSGHLQELLTLTLINALGILMSSTGLELDARRDVDLNQELRTHGLAQLVSGVAGGFPGFVNSNRSALNLRLGSPTRAAGYVAAGATLCYAIAGPWLVSVVPKAVLGGLIIFLGYSLIWRWVWTTRKSTSWPEYLAMLLIALCVTVWGFVSAMVLGVIIACLMFVISYSRVSAVKHQLSGAVLSSSVVRSRQQTAVIKQYGDELRIFVLQGFLFFGTADRLYRRFGEQTQGQARPVRYVILDFRLVGGIDSSAVSSFRKIASQAESRGIRLITTGVGEYLAPDLAVLEKSAWALRFDQLDNGLQWCETELLRTHGPDETMTVPTIRDWLAGEFGSRDAASEFLRHVEQREVPEGEYLCREGDAAESMFFISEGRFVIERAGSDGRPQRLRTLGRHTMIGEMGLYRSETRSASVVAREASRVYVLSREALDKMRAASPALAEALCVALIRTMAERLSYSNSLNATLQD